MRILMRNRARKLLIGALAALALGVAPWASARSHIGLGISIGGPGFGIGYSSCRHCGGGYVSGYVAPYLGGYYAPAYYGPAYYGPTYYGPSYYEESYPAYGAVYYDSPVVVRHGHYGRGYRDHRIYRGGHRDGYDHRARYYDRDGY